MPKDATLPNFPEKAFVNKAFANSHKTVKFATVFSLESFPPYGTYMYHRNTTGYHGYITFILLTGRGATAVSQAAEEPIYIATATSRSSAADPGQY